MSIILQEQLCGQICLEAIKTLALMMESLLLSSRNLKISVKGLSQFQFDLKECKSMCKECGVWQYVYEGGEIIFTLFIDFVQSSIAGVSGLTNKQEEAMKFFARLSAVS